MDKETIYTEIQKMFGRGIVTLIGSGASCARGLPSMGQLATHLISNITRDLLVEADWEAWEPIAAQLGKGDGLEVALDIPHVPETLLNLIVRESGSCVAAAEAEEVEKLLAGETDNILGPLMQILLVTNDQPDVITTNYDRLIEIDAALHGIRVDTMFYGQTLGRLNEKLAREELMRFTRTQARARPRGEMSLRPHIRLAKPHGSLDWRLFDGAVIRTDFTTNTAARIITPGLSKYREGYERPFDDQRDRANRAINAATAFLTLGYGFNDPHLQTHLKTRFTEVPALVLAHRLTDSAKAYLTSNERAIGIESSPTAGQSVAHQAGEQMHLDGDLWQIENLISEVLT